MLIIPFDAAAAKTSLVTNGETGTLSLVGVVTTETVALQVKAVPSPDVTNDAHWTALMQEDEAVVLRAGHNVVHTPSRVLLRLVKAAGVSSNTYGVEWS